MKLQVVFLIAASFAPSLVLAQEADHTLLSGVVRFRCIQAGRTVTQTTPDYVEERHFSSATLERGILYFSPQGSGSYAVHNCSLTANCLGGGWWNRTYRDGRREIGQLQQQQSPQQPSEHCREIPLDILPGSLDEALSSAREAIERAHSYSACRVEFSALPPFTITAPPAEPQQQPGPGRSL